MSRAAALRQRDVQAAVRGAMKAGFDVGRVEITPEGRILILPATGSPPPMGDDLDDELRAWRERHDQG